MNNQCLALSAQKQALNSCLTFLTFCIYIHWLLKKYNKARPPSPFNITLPSTRGTVHRELGKKVTTGLRNANTSLANPSSKETQPLKAQGDHAGATVPGQLLGVNCAVQQKWQPLNPSELRVYTKRQLKHGSDDKQDICLITKPHGYFHLLFLWILN